ncbi:TetR/AcrR family transcriptional regulator [Aurantivibrio plasticivorans]
MPELNTVTAPKPMPLLTSKISDQDPQSLPNKIVDAFAERAKHVGIRSIAIGDIAKELRISTKTFYKYFRTKDDIVHEMIVRWESRIHKPIEYYGDDLLEILRLWVKIWVDNDARFSTAFWTDLKSDYPELGKVYVDSLYQRMAVMKQRVTPFLKEGLNHDFVWSVYFILMAGCAKRTNYEKIGMTQKESVFEAFEFWVNSVVDLDKLNAAQQQNNS